MKTISLVALAVAAILSSTALAGNQHEKEKVPSPTSSESAAASHSNSTSSASSNSSSVSTGGVATTTVSNSVAGGAGGVGGSSTATNQGVSLTNSSSYNAPRNAPSVFAPSVFPTANCLGGFSIGGSGPNGGGTLGFGFTKKECATIVLAQNLASLGLTQEACEALMSTPSAKRVWPSGTPSCRTQKPETENENLRSTVVDMSAYVTRSELAEREKRIFESAVAK